MPKAPGPNDFYYRYTEGLVDEQRLLRHQRDLWVAQLKAEYADINARCHDHEAHIARLTGALDEMQSSFAWKLTWPLRYVASRFGKKGGEAPGAGGAPAATADAAVDAPLVLTPPLPAEGESLPTLDASVSFIIPVYNGGEALAQLLPVLRAQRGFAATEVVVVDSGSTDGSLECCAEHGAVVVQIPNAAFTHAHARNLAAEKAGGDLLVFLTQDALPTGSWWARRLVQPLVDGVAEAASCREIPREGAGLYARAGIWHHQRFLGIDGRDRIATWPGEDDPVAIRQNAGLNSVATAIPRALFAQYRFEGAYAEDLQLGIRLLKDGRRLALLSSEGIIHSHDRPPMYTLKRSFVEEGLFIGMLPGREPEAMPAGHLCFLAVTAHRELGLLCGFVRAPAGTLTAEALGREVAVFCAALPLYLHGTPANAPLGTSGDDALDAVVAQLAALPQQPQGKIQALALAFSDYYEHILQPYLQATVDAVDATVREDVCDCFAKFYAARLGGWLAAYARHAPQPDTLAAITGPLAAGI